MKIALDTNVLAYAEGTNGTAMQDKALELIQRLPQGDIVLPVQTLGELFNVLVRKAKRRPARARAAVLSWRDAYPTVETSADGNDQRNGSGLRSWTYDLGLGCGGGLGGSRMSFASVGGSPRGVHVAWRHRHQPVCADAPPSVGGVAHADRGVISSRGRIGLVEEPRLHTTFSAIRGSISFRMGSW